MSNRQRIHETVTDLPSLEHLIGRIREGWRPVAIEWERDAASAPEVVEEIPYGLRVAEDGSGLVADQAERQVIIAALDLIVDDHPLSRVAEELNRRGHTTREGRPWTPTSLFVLLPRMIELGPRLFTSDDWMTRKERLRRVV